MEATGDVLRLELDGKRALGVEPDTRLVLNLLKGDRRPFFSEVADGGNSTFNESDDVLDSIFLG